METVDRICEAFVRSPAKSTVQASRELRIPHLTLWKVLRKRVKLKPYSTNLMFVDIIHRIVFILKNVSESGFCLFR
jgi:hypothetical protein